MIPKIIDSNRKCTFTSAQTVKICMMQAQEATRPLAVLLVSCEVHEQPATRHFLRCLIVFHQKKRKVDCDA